MLLGSSDEHVKRSQASLEAPQAANSYGIKAWLGHEFSSLTRTLCRAPERTDWKARGARLRMPKVAAC